MDTKPPHWTERLHASLPNRGTLAAHPWLRPLAYRLLAPQLWRLQPEAVARGVAVGTFWAFVLPIGQVLAAVAHCAWWRANIPAAAAMTLVTNPFTIGFWLWLAYQAGVGVLGEPLPSAATADATSWLLEYGWPTVLGMGMFAVGGAAVGYLAVKGVWRMRRALRRYQRRLGG